MGAWQAIAVGLIPSIAVGLLFWYVMRAVVRADRNERAALAAIEDEQMQSDAPIVGTEEGPTRET
ncbi:hypothetical protein [Demequina sp.]|uniref:hypothetical protein n=1 Tax=Demequina sp. TaxID=2050685 RepID=UPI003A8C14DE